jgi:hypothetical protein
LLDSFVHLVIYFLSPAWSHPISTKFRVYRVSESGEGSSENRCRIIWERR